MHIEDAQRDVRTVFLGGFVGQLVSGLLWLSSAALASGVSHRAGILFLLIGGVFIFPLTQLGLRLLGHRASLHRGHPMNALAMQTAFIVPLCLPLVGAVLICRQAWFYPALMIVVGAHYLPFMFLYGMRQFAALAGLLIAAALSFAVFAPSHFALPGWFAGSLLIVFAFLGRRVAQS